MASASLVRQLAACSACITASGSHIGTANRATAPAPLLVSSSGQEQRSGFNLKRFGNHGQKDFVQRRNAKGGICASIDPSKTAAEMQQSRPAARDERITGGGKLAQPGSLQSSMAEDMEEVESNGNTTSSEGNLAQSDVAPAESPAVQETADRAAGGDAYKGSRLISVEDGPKPSFEPAYKAATEKVVDVEAEKEGDEFRGSKLISSEGSLAQSDVEPAESPAIKRAADRAANMSSEGNLAQSDVEPAESEAVERAADRASEGNLAQSDVEPAESEQVQRFANRAAGQAESVKEDAQKNVEAGIEKGEQVAEKGKSVAENVGKDAQKTVEAGSEKGEEVVEKGKSIAKEGVEKVKEVAADIQGAVEHPEKLAEKISEPVKEGLESASHLTDQVQEKASNLVDEVKGEVNESKADDAAKNVAHQAKDAAGGIAESAKQTASSGHNTSQEGNLAESDVAPAESSVVERTADALSHKDQQASGPVDETQRSREAAVKARVQEKLGATSTTDKVGSNKYTVEVIEAHEKLNAGKKAGRPGAVGFQKETKERTAVKEATTKADEAKSAGRMGAVVFEGEAKERVQNTKGTLYK